MTIQTFPLPSTGIPQETNSLGPLTSSGPLTLFLLSYNWEDILDDLKVSAAAQKLIEDIDNVAKGKGVGSL